MSIRALILVVAASTGAAVLAAGGGPAGAAFPGLNGKLVFTSLRDGNAELYSANPDGSGERRLTASTSQDMEATWSPDGSKIAYTSDLELYSMNGDGTG